MDAKHFGVFVLAFICGGVLVYFTAPPTDTIVVYPTPTNVKRVEYRDRAGNCYKYTAKKIKCPRSGAVTIPLQE